MMMDYFELKEMVEEKLKDYLPGPYKKRGIQILPQWEDGRFHDMLSLVPENGETEYPVVCMYDIFVEYMDTGSCECALEEAADRLAGGMTAGHMGFIDTDSLKENIIPMLINTEKNGYLLEHVPNRPFLDLSVVYRIAGKDSERMQTAMVDIHTARHLGLTEEQLYNKAKENIETCHAPQAKRVDSFLRDLFTEEGMDRDMAGALFQNPPKDRSIWMLYYDSCPYGAGALLFEDRVHALAEEMQKDLYIMPLSIHEAAAVADDAGMPEYFAQWLSLNNRENVDRKDYLSDSLYRYDRSTRTFSIACSAPEIRHGRRDAMPDHTRTR